MLPQITFVLDHFIGLNWVKTHVDCSVVNTMCGFHYITILFYIHENFIVRPPICFGNSIEMQTVLLLSIKLKKENRLKS